MPANRECAPVLTNTNRLAINGADTWRSRDATLPLSAARVRRAVARRRRPATDTMPLPFNKSLDLKLLKLVKENPILYNTRNAKYLDFDSREVVWQKIGDALSRPGKSLF